MSHFLDRISTKFCLKFLKYLAQIKILFTNFEAIQTSALAYNLLFLTLWIRPRFCNCYLKKQSFDQVDHDYGVRYGPTWWPFMFRKSSKSDEKPLHYPFTFQEVVNLLKYFYFHVWTNVYHIIFKNSMKKFNFFLAPNSA